MIKKRVKAYLGFKRRLIIAIKNFFNFEVLTIFVDILTYFILAKRYIAEYWNFKLRRHYIFEVNSIGSLKYVTRTL